MGPCCAKSTIPRMHKWRPSIFAALHFASLPGMGAICWTLTRGIKGGARRCGSCTTSASILGLHNGSRRWKMEIFLFNRRRSFDDVLSKVRKNVVVLKIKIVSFFIFFLISTNDIQMIKEGKERFETLFLFLRHVTRNISFTFLIQQQFNHYFLYFQNLCRIRRARWTNHERNSHKSGKDVHLILRGCLNTDLRDISEAEKRSVLAERSVQRRGRLNSSARA